MCRLLVLLFSLITFQSSLCICAFSLSPLKQQQSSPATQTPQNAECQDVPSCRKRIRDLEAEINELRGASTDNNKTQISSLARSLRRSQSTLSRLEGDKGKMQGRETHPNKSGSEPLAVNSSAPLLTPQNFLDL